MKKSLSLFWALSLALCIPVFGAEATFSDVPAGHWSSTYVETAAEKGWITGDGHGNFLPNDDVTYAQMCVMVVKAFFSDDFAAYTGSSSPWYAPYTSVAAQVGLLNGTDVEKAPTDAGKVNTPCSRMEMALIVYNAMSASGGNMPSAEEIKDAGYSTPDMPSYMRPYTNAIAAAKAAGIINGVDDKGTFSGRENMTRAQLPWLWLSWMSTWAAPASPIPEPIRTQSLTPSPKIPVLPQADVIPMVIPWPLV